MILYHWVIPFSNFCKKKKKKIGQKFLLKFFSSPDISKFIENQAKINIFPQILQQRHLNIKYNITFTFKDILNNNLGQNRKN